MNPANTHASSTRLVFFSEAHEKKIRSSEVESPDLSQIVTTITNLREITLLAQFQAAAKKCGLYLKKTCRTVSPESLFPQNLIDSFERAYAWEMAFSRTPFNDLNAIQAEADRLYETGAADTEIQIVSQAVIQSGHDLFQKPTNQATIYTFKKKASSSTPTMAYKSGDN